MQITVKLKGYFRIVLFFLIVSSLLCFGAYKAYRYISYRNIVRFNDRKQKQNLTFGVTVLAADSSSREYILTSTLAPWRGKNYSSLVILDTKGDILLQRQMPGIVYDFRQWQMGGSRFYSYGINAAKDSAADVTASSGHFVILDSALNEVRQIHFVRNDGSTDTLQDLDIHDLIMLAPGHFITIAAVPKTVNNIPVYLSPNPKCRLLVPVIQEVDNGRVTWQWQADKFPEFYANSNAGNNFYDTTALQDYMHINSIALDPKDSTLIVSFLNLNQVIKIDRHSGNIVWRLGGKNSDFALAKDQYFIRQHHATFTDSATLMLLDNGDATMRPYSRILTFRVGEAEKKITFFSSWTIPEKLAGSRGSVQKKNEDYLVCGGIANYLLLANSRTGAKKMELKANQTFYRAYLVDDITGITSRK